jgi:hypothetical protein
MTTYINNCVSCGLPCDSRCGLSHEAVTVCDRCGKEEQLYQFEGQELCAACIAEQLPVLDIDYCCECGNFEELSEYEDEYLCIYCILHRLKKV